MASNKTVAIVGLGYVGLPLAKLASKKDWQVIGVDVDDAKIAEINKTNTGIMASSDFSTVSEAQVVIVAVPTPVHDNYEPDLGPLKSAVQSLVPFLSDQQVLIIESTINPGVMDEIVKPLVESTGVELVHCPERINPGDKKWTVANIPRVLGGYSPAGTKKAKNFYDSILDAEVKVMNSVTEAEAVKILENTFRDINIAFINEMAQSFDKLDIDISNVIAGAATKPFAFMPHYPSNGVGGHCISVDPYYMIERGKKAGFDHKFLKLAREINNYMPHYAVNLLLKQLDQLKLDPKKTTVALLGLAYKKNIDDIRESPALDIKKLLEDAGVNLKIYDPYLLDQSSEKLLDDAISDADAIMLATDHDEFTAKLTADYLNQKNIKSVVDGKNALNKEDIERSGILYHGIGR